jgi:hypothetical protein
VISSKVTEPPRDQAEAEFPPPERNDIQKSPRDPTEMDQRDLITIRMLDEPCNSADSGRRLISGRDPCLVGVAEAEAAAEVAGVAGVAEEQP